MSKLSSIVLQLTAFFLPFSAWAPLVVGGIGIPLSLIFALMLFLLSVLRGLASRRSTPYKATINQSDVFLYVWILVIMGNVTIQIFHGNNDITNLLAIFLAFSVYYVPRFVDPQGLYFDKAVMAFIWGNVASSLFGVYQIAANMAGRLPLSWLNNNPDYSEVATTGHMYFRAYGFSPEPSLMVGPLFTALILLAGLNPRRIKRPILFVLVSVICAGMILTMSNLLIVSPFIVFLVMLVTRRHRNTVKWPFYMVASVGLSASLILGFTHFMPNWMLVRFDNMFSITYKVTNESARFSTVQGALNLFSSNPVFGAGVGVARHLVSTGGRSGVIDSYIVSVLAEEGLIGLVACLAFWFSFTLSGYLYSRRMGRSASSAKVAAACLAVGAAFVAQSLTTSAVTFYYIWFWAGYASVVLAFYKARNGADSTILQG